MKKVNIFLRFSYILGSV